MLRSFKIILVVLMAVAMYSCTPKAKEIPINDFFKTPEKTNFKLSPDGQYVSYLKAVKGKQNLYIASVTDVVNNTGKARDAGVLGNGESQNYLWTFDNQI